MRTSKSFKNSIINMFCNLCIMLIGLISQAFFIRILGAEYLGINGLFNNILSILGIVELGMGSAIIYNLYKPIANNDIETVKSLLNFYKKAYYLIGLFIFSIGICILPFISFFVGKITINLNIKFIFILFLFHSVSTYILSYRSSIFIACQENYIVKINNLLYRLTLAVLQILVLFVTKNYYLYLMLAILIQLMFNYLIYKKAELQFNYLKDKHVKPLDKEIELSIFTKIRALFFHKVGGFIINGTDNIIISKFINVVTVGFYSNYQIIISAVNTLFGQVISSCSASVGNLLVTENERKIFCVFKRIRFLSFWIAVFSGSCIFCLIQPFIHLWVGLKYTLPISVVFVLVLNFYQSIMRGCYSVFKDAAGIWEEDKIVPLIESCVNIVFSIILVKQFGLIGVFIGTLISSLIIWLYSYPKFVYKRLFYGKYCDYIKENLGYFLIFLFIVLLMHIICVFITIDNLIIQLLVKLLICLIIPNIIVLIIFFKNDNLTYYKKLIKKYILKF